jgi:hypothetical protein
MVRNIKDFINYGKSSFLGMGSFVAIICDMASVPSHPNLKYYFRPSQRLDIKLETDICVYGGNSGGVIAAIAAKRKGLRVILLEPGRHLGGLTAGGLGLTDIGNKFAIGGLSREFYRRVGRCYGLLECWRFEPSVAERVFAQWLDEMDITCYFESFLHTLAMEGDRIRSITTENGIQVEARQFIDASYEGDLMARAGVSYTVGREGNRVYGETFNGAQVLDKHQFRFDVDPYVAPGDSSSGLLEGIDPEPYVQGRGDRRIQAYNFRLCLTDDPANRLPFDKPEGYDRSDYELLVRYCQAGYVPEFDKFDRLINSKIDMNNHGAVSTDFIGQNHAFPEADYAEREVIFQRHVSWVKGLLWFWANDPVVDPAFQEKFRTWGWPRDEFTETGGFPHALYVREARRLLGDVVMTEHHCTGRDVAGDAVGLAAYTMDSHNCRRVVIDGNVHNEGDVQIHSGPPYPISYRSIVPRSGECENVFVPFCLSASHIAFGSIRMEPVFMILAESAVEAAALAIEEDIPVQQVPYWELRERLITAGQVIDPVPPVKDVQAGE